MTEETETEMGKCPWYLKPIPRDPSIDKMDKKTAAYRYKVHKLSCILCTNVATQMMCFDVDGAIVIQRYCDDCVSKVTN